MLFSLSRSVLEVVNFLEKQKLDEHIIVFEENQIDGEILSSIIAHKDVDEILEGLGVKLSAHQRKITLKFKKFYHSASSSAHGSKAD